MNRVKNNELCYFIMITLIILRIYINNSVLENLFPIYDKILIPLIMLFAFLTVLNEKYTLKNIIIIFSLFILLFLVSIKTGKMLIMVSYISIVLSKNIDIKKIIKCIAIVNSILLSFFIFTYIFNLILNKNSIVINHYYLNMPRHSFYFNHPNMFSSLIFWNLCSYLYLKEKNINKIEILIILLITLVVYKCTYTRTMLLSMIVTIILFLMRNNLKLRKILSNCNKFSVALSLIFSLFILKNYNHFNFTILKMINKIDALLSHRIKIALLAYNKVGLSIFPRTIDYFDKLSWGNSFESNFILDNVYFESIIVYGGIFCILLSLFFYFGNKKNKNGTESIFIFVGILTGFMERMMLNSCICFPILLIGKQLITGGEENEQD